MEGVIISSSGSVEVKSLKGRFGLEIVPSLTILAGRLVVAREGSYHVLRKAEREIGFSDLVKSLSEEFDAIHLVDLESITEGKAQLSTLRDAAEDVEVWYDGGFASSEEIFDPIMMGAAKIVIGTKSLMDLNMLLDCFELTPNVVFEMDYHNGIMSPTPEISGMGIDRLIEKVRSIGISEMIVADFGRMEEKGDLDFSLLEHTMKKGMRTYVAGNITPTDLPILADMGAAGAIMKLESVIE